MMVIKETFYVGSQKVYNAISIDLKTLQFLIAYLYNVYKKIYQYLVVFAFFFFIFYFLFYVTCDKKLKTSFIIIIIFKGEPKRKKKKMLKAKKNLAKQKYSASVTLNFLFFF